VIGPGIGEFTPMSLPKSRDGRRDDATWQRQEHAHGSLLPVGAP